MRLTTRGGERRDGARPSKGRERRWEELISNKATDKIGADWSMSCRVVSFALSLESARTTCSGEIPIIGLLVEAASTK